MDKYSITLWLVMSSPGRSWKMLSLEAVDTSHGMVRTEVRSSGADSHLGHVFNDGPRASPGASIASTSAALDSFPTMNWKNKVCISFSRQNNQKSIQGGIYHGRKRIYEMDKNKKTKKLQRKHLLPNRITVEGR